MKRIIITPILMLLLSSCATTGDYFSWDETNTKLHVPLTLLMIADLGQTLDIADHCREITTVYTPQEQNGILYDDNGNKQSFYYTTNEANNVLSRCPTRTHAKQYFGWMLTGITFTVWASPPKLSHHIQGGVIGVQLYVVAGNYYAGVGWGW